MSPLCRLRTRIIFASASGLLILQGIPLLVEWREEARARAEYERLKTEGREEAEADITNGKLKLRTWGYIDCRMIEFWNLLNARCGVERECVAGCLLEGDPRWASAVWDGYNERMKEEIERRFGDGCLESLKRESRLLLTKKVAARNVVREKEGVVPAPRQAAGEPVLSVR